MFWPAEGKVKVYKYDVPIASMLEIELPSDRQIMSLQVQKNVPRIWVLFRTDSPTETVRFRWFKTGDYISAYSSLTYVGTVQIASGNLVYHLFEEIKSG